MHRNSPIAIIDSGMGGLTLFKNLYKKYNSENYIYLADNQYMPYGNKSSKFIKNRLLELVNYLYNTFNVKLVILGCNTASISALEYLKKHSPVEIRGLDLTSLDLIKDDYAILCTKLSSKGYENLVTYNCKGLAKFIEDNYFNKVALRRKIKNTMLNINQNNIVLGCTHYELIANQFKAISNKNFVLPCKEFVKNFKLTKQNLNSKTGDILMLSTIPTKSYIDKLWKIFKGL